MFTIAELMMKIKATLTVIIGDNDKLLTSIQNQYLNNTCILLEEKDDEVKNVNKSEYQKFLDRDEREYLKENMNKIVKDQIR